MVRPRFEDASVAAERPHLHRDRQPARMYASEACTMMRARYRQAAVRATRATWAATSGSGGSGRGVKRGPLGVRSSIRSTRNVRQSSRSMSHATRYQRRPIVHQAIGLDRTTTRRPGVRPVFEPQTLVIPARPRDHGQDLAGPPGDRRDGAASA